MAVILVAAVVVILAVAAVILVAVVALILAAQPVQTLFVVHLQAAHIHQQQEVVMQAEAMLGAL